MSEVKLPRGWVATNVGSYLYLKNGYAFKSKDYIEKAEGASPVIRISDVKPSGTTTKKSVYVSNSVVPDGFLVEKGDLLIAMSGATTGKTGVYLENHPAHQNQRVGNLKLHSEKLGCKRYKDFLIQHLSSSILKIAYGGAQPNISGKAIEEIEVTLPPLNEQTRIANKLDELLAQVDTIKARVDAIPAILKRFRQSVLAAAVSGKLTEEWRGSAVVRNPAPENSWGWSDLPGSWLIKSYPDVVDSRLGKMLDKSKNKGVPTAYLGNINVRWLSFSLEKIQEILISEEERVEFSVAPNDVLICEGGEPGRCAIWKDESSEPMVFQKALHRARCKAEIIPEWLVYNLKVDADSKKLDQLFTGTTIKHLTGRALKSYQLRIAPMDEQKQIVQRVEQLFTFADQIEQRVADAQSRIDSLTQSILAKAFRGELVPQDPNDEPASELLARIQKEREEAAALLKAAKESTKKPAKKPARKTKS